MTELTPAARAIVDAARPLSDPTAEDAARAHAALRKALAASTVAAAAPATAAAAASEPRLAPPANTAAALAMGHAARGLLALVLLVASAALFVGRPAPAPTTGAPSSSPRPLASPARATPRPPATRARAPSELPPHFAAPRATPPARHAPPPAVRARSRRLAVRGGLDALVATRAPAAAAPTVARAAHATPPAAPAPRSDALTNALQLYQSERFAEAAVELQRVVEGATADAPEHVARAQFFLGKALFQLGLYQSALTVFDEIVDRGAEHPYFAATLPWLAQLAARLPEPARVAERVARYEPAQLAALDTPDNAAQYDQLVYLLGRARYDAGLLPEAVALFRRVRHASRYFVRARLFEATAHVRAHRAAPAVAALRAALAALEDGTTAEPERQRMTDLVWMELARVYYSTRHYASAIDAWGRVAQSSEYWLDAQFEASWAHFLTGDNARALGNVMTLNTPYFERAYYPESLLLRSVILYSHCDYAAAERAVAEFNRRFGALRAPLERFLAAHADNGSLVRLLRALRGGGRGGASVPRALDPVVRAALADRALLRHLEYLEELEGEARRLAALPEAFRQSTLGARALADGVVANSYAVDSAAALVRARYQRALDELQELTNQGTAIQIEVLDARRGEAEIEARGGRARASALPAQGQPYAVDELEDGQHWPVDSEIWRDEVGTYRVPIVSRCGR